MKRKVARQCIDVLLVLFLILFTVGCGEQKQAVAEPDDKSAIECVESESYAENDETQESVIKTEDSIYL